MAEWSPRFKIGCPRFSDLVSERDMCKNIIKTNGFRDLQRKIGIKPLFFFASGAGGVKSSYKSNGFLGFQRNVTINVMFFWLPVLDVRKVDIKLMVFVASGEK